MLQTLEIMNVTLQIFKEVTTHIKKGKASKTLIIYGQSPDPDSSNGLVTHPQQEWANSEWLLEKQPRNRRNGEEELRKEERGK